MRPDFALLRFCIVEMCALCLRDEIHGLRTIPEVYVGGDTDNLVHSRVLLWSRAEMPPDRVLLAKEPLRKRLVNHRHRPRIRVVLVGDGPSHHDLFPEGLEKSRRHARPTGCAVVLWFALNPDVTRPNPAGQRRTEYRTDHTHAGDGAQ